MSQSSSTYSNFPNGFANGLLVRGLPLVQTNPGKVFWLYNGTVFQRGQIGGSDSNNGTFNAPFATLNYAISKCVAGRGDVIMVKAGHAETVSSATALNFATAGVSIVGQGYGSLRPTFTLNTANTATIPVTAANMSIQNCIFIANFLSIASCFTLTAAPEFNVQQCKFVDTSSVLNFLNIVTTTGAANTNDGLVFSQNEVYNLGVTSNNTTCLLSNTTDRFNAQANRLFWAIQNNTASLVIVSAGILTNALITDNYSNRPNTSNTGGALINVGGTTSTGIVANNYVQSATSASEIIFVTTVGLAAFQNWYSAATGSSGKLIPAVSA